MDRSSNTLELPGAEQSPEVLRAAVDLATDAVLFVAPHSLCLVGANRSACVGLGYVRDELLGVRLTGVAPDAEAGQLAEAIDSVRRRETPSVKVRSALRCRGTEWS